MEVVLTEQEPKKLVEYVTATDAVPQPNRAKLVERWLSRVLTRVYQVTRAPETILSKR